MRQVVWSQDALADFEQSLLYIAARDATAAHRVADRIDAAAGLLAEMPVGRPGRVFGTYEKPVAHTPYIIAYALNSTSITIVRLIHGARDWREGEWPE